MTDFDELDAIVNKLEDMAENIVTMADGDREIDVQVWLVLNEGATRRQWEYAHKRLEKITKVDETRDKSGLFISVPAYTSSVDAVIDLINNKLATNNPGWKHSYHPTLHGWEGSVIDPNHRYVFGEGTHPARALLCAALRAIAMERAHGR